MLVAADTDNALVIGWCKFLVTDWLMAFVTLETFGMPFPSFILEFLHPCNNKRLTLCHSRI